jgi:hypothetical protein
VTEGASSDATGTALSMVGMIMGASLTTVDFTNAAMGPRLIKLRIDGFFFFFPASLSRLAFAFLHALLP